MRVLTAVLLVIAAALGGVLAYRSFFAPLGGTTVDTRPLAPAAPLVRDDGSKGPLVRDGKARLVFFGFTRCPDVCPITLAALGRAYGALPEARRANLEVALVTVDPAFDTPARLRAYLDKFDRAFAGFTGSEKALDEVRRGFFMYANKTGPGAFSHGDAVVLVDPEGRLRRVYNQGTVSDGTLARDLPRIAAGRY